MPHLFCSASQRVSSLIAASLSPKTQLWQGNQQHHLASRQAPASFE